MKKASVELIPCAASLPADTTKLLTDTIKLHGACSLTASLTQSNCIDDTILLPVDTVRLIFLAVKLITDAVQLHISCITAVYGMHCRCESNQSRCLTKQSWLLLNQFYWHHSSVKMMSFVFLMVLFAIFLQFFTRRCLHEKDLLPQQDVR